MTLEIRGSLVNLKPVSAVLLLAHLVAQCLQFSIERMNVELEKSKVLIVHKICLSYSAIMFATLIYPLLRGSLSCKECRLGNADSQPNVELGSSQPM